MVRKLKLKESIIYNSYSEMKDNLASLELKRLCSKYGYTCEKIPHIEIENGHGFLQTNIHPKIRGTVPDVGSNIRNQDDEIIKYDTVDFSLFKPFYTISTRSCGSLCLSEYEQYVEYVMDGLEFLRKLEDFDFSQLPKYYK